MSSNPERLNGSADSQGRPTPARLVAAVAFALAAWSGVAGAAGLGRLSVTSALGQPLRAEVEVTAVTREEANSLSARLASPEAYRAAGLQFNNALAGLRMEVLERGGRHFVGVTSGSPINEPFVDLVVELNWASGRFVREYTFLLDPPELRSSRQTVEGGSGAGTAAAPAARASAGRAAPQSPQNASTANPANASNASGASTVASDDSVAVPPAPGGVRAQAQAPRAEPAGVASPGSGPGEGRRTDIGSDPDPASTAVGGAGADTVIVVRGDTLGRIAASVQPAGVTLEQTIIAIYQANRRAFISNNPNLLREGRTLTIPDAAAIALVDPSLAQRQLRIAAQNFRAYKERLAVAPPEVGTAGTGTSASGSIAAQVEDGASAPRVADRLELSRSTGAAGAQGGAVGSRDAEARVARDAALTESNSRIAQLERSVADLQRMLELKNKSLADLQARLEQQRPQAAATNPAAAVGAAAPGAAAGAAATAAVPGTVAGAGPTVKPGADPGAPATPPVTSANGAGTASTGAPDPASPGAATAPAIDPLAQGGNTVGQPSAITAPGAAADRSQPAPPAAAAPQPLPEPSLWDTLADRQNLLPILGVLALLGGLGIWMAMRRRKVEHFEDSVVGGQAFTASSLFGPTGPRGTDATGIQAPDGATADAGSPSEVDPIAEADVYIAYGREAQAEEILREALKGQPQRQAIRLKLMEIFAGRRDVGAFAAMAREMHDMSGGRNDEWPKVAAMGFRLDPQNALFASASRPDSQQSVPAQHVPGNPVTARAGAAGSAVAGSVAAGSVAAGSIAAGSIALGPVAPGLVAAGPAASAGVITPRSDDGAPNAPLYAYEAPAAPVRHRAPDEVADLDFNLDTAGPPESAGPGQGKPDARALEASVPDVDEQDVRNLDASYLDAGNFGSDQAGTGGGFDDTSTFTRSRPGPLSAMPNVDLPSLDLDFPSPPPSGRNASAGDFSPDLPARERSPATGSNRDFAADHALDLSAIGLDLEPSTGSGPSTITGTGSGQWQEMASKLDLASAYGEIGDKEGARELLQEVVRGGDAAQQQKARELLASI